MNSYTHQTRHECVREAGTIVDTARRSETTSSAADRSHGGAVSLRDMERPLLNTAIPIQPMTIHQNPLTLHSLPPIPGVTCVNLSLIQS